MVKLFSGRVIERALGETGYANFQQTYEEAKLKGGRYSRMVTKRDLDIFDAWKKEKLMEGELAARFGMSRQRIRTGLLLAARVRFDEVGA